MSVERVIKQRLLVAKFFSLSLLFVHIFFQLPLPRFLPGDECLAYDYDGRANDSTRARLGGKL